MNTSPFFFKGKWIMTNRNITDSILIFKKEVDKRTNIINGVMFSFEKERLKKKFTIQ